MRKLSRDKAEIINKLTKIFDEHIQLVSKQKADMNNKIYTKISLLDKAHRVLTNIQKITGETSSHQTVTRNLSETERLADYVLQYASETNAYTYFEYNKTEDVIENVDKLSARVALEAHSKFMDDKVVEDSRKNDKLASVGG